jgi:hypothetical protein
MICVRQRIRKSDTECREAKPSSAYLPTRASRDGVRA